MELFSTVSRMKSKQVKELARYVRAMRKEAPSALAGDTGRARDLILGGLASHALESILLTRSDLSARHAREGLMRVLGIAGEYTSSGCDRTIPHDVRESVASDVLMVGWAYQFWHEAERDASTWAISRQGEQRSPLHSTTAATQIFTEDYMAYFVVRRVLNLVTQSDAAPTIFDPACGAGHILVHALRLLSSHPHRTEPVEALVARLCGSDVDASVVRLCRAILFLEALRLGCTDMNAVLYSLERSVIALPYEHGALRRDSHDEISKGLYTCVITNPPYVGRRKLTQETRTFLDTHYPATSMDLCAAFMQRCVEFAQPGGAVGLVTVDKWLRLKGYEQLRTGGPGFAGLYKTLSLDVVCELGQRAFSQVAGLHDGVGISLLTGRVEPPGNEHVFHFISLADARCSDEKSRLLEQWQQSSGNEPGVRTQSELLSGHQSEQFLRTPGIPRVLTRPDMTTVRDRARVVVGLQTSDDRAFVRYVWSVPPRKERWKVHSKGGGYGRWFGLNRFLIDWSSGRPIFERNPKSGLSVEPWFDEEGWTYSWFANGSLGLRRKERGWSFGRAAASGIFCEDPRIVAFLNSRVASLMVRRIGGKAQLPEGIVRKIPLPESLGGIDGSLVDAAVAIKRKLVSRDLTDVSFVPGQSWHPAPSFYLEALLLLVEGALEWQVLESLAATDSEKAALDAAMGRPVAWNARRHFDDDSFWRAIPNEFRSLRRKLQVDSSSNELYDEKGDVSALQELLREGGNVHARQVGFPISSSIEGMCRGSGLHPCDVVRFVEASVDEDPVVRRAILAPAVSSKLVEEVLRALGHQWWSTAEVYSPCRHREFSHAELVRHMSLVPVSSEIEDLLGTGIEQWLRSRLPSVLSRLFYRASPIDIAKRGARYTHQWASIELTRDESKRAVGL